MAVVKFDYDISRDVWRYWMQVDEGGLVWYPVVELDDELQGGKTQRHNIARRVIATQHAIGPYKGVAWQDMAVEVLKPHEIDSMVYVEDRGVYLIDMRGKT